MGGINISKMLVGGFVAGFVINCFQSVVHLFLLAEQSAALTEGMGLPGPTGGQIAMYWLISFLVGWAMIFVYAAIRPRFGAGMSTAALAAVVTFVLAELIPAWFYIVSGLFEFGVYLPFMLATLIILLVAAMAGACVYTEEQAGP